jgi:hypothetical protein
MTVKYFCQREKISRSIKWYDNFMTILVTIEVTIVVTIVVASWQ